MNIKERLPVLFFDEYPVACGAGALPSFHFAEFFSIPIFILCAPSAHSVFRK